MPRGSDVNDFLDWVFERFRGIGGTGGRGLRRTLSGSGLREAHRLGRELPQNSRDAASSPRGLVEMYFRLRRLTGRAREKLVRLLRVEQLIERGLVQPLPDPLPVLYVEDFGTVGLGGVDRADVPRNFKRDRYVGLCLTFGDADENASGGGTFGFGKSVTWNASRSRLVLFHSRFQPDDRTGRVHSRLIGTGLFQTHNHQGARYTGRAFLSRLSDEEDYVPPLTNGEADRVAAELGFVPRPDATKTGTSILMVNTDLDSHDHLEQVREGIELYYWPAIIDGRLKVHLLDEDEELPPPNPERRADLAPYIGAYRRARALLDGEEIAASAAQWHGLVTRYSDVLGALALTAVADPELSVETDDNGAGDDGQRVDTVALIRSPRMVVCYKAPYQRARDSHFIGVFIADPQFNQDLAKSEPPAHNDWDPNADELNEDARRRIECLHREIKRLIKEFLRSQRTREIEQTDGCPLLDRELADLIRMPDIGAGTGRTGEGNAPGPGRRGAVKPSRSGHGGGVRSRPWDIEFEDGPRPDRDANGRQIVTATVRLNVWSAEDRASLGPPAASARYAELTFHPRIVIEDGERDAEELGVASITEHTDLGDAAHRNARARLRLPAEAASYRLTIRTEPLQHDEQTVDLVPTVTLKSR
jgi:hypothetical protein